MLFIINCIIFTAHIAGFCACVDSEFFSLGVGSVTNGVPVQLTDPMLVIVFTVLAQVLGAQVTGDGAHVLGVLPAPLVRGVTDGILFIQTVPEGPVVLARRLSSCRRSGRRCCWGRRRCRSHRCCCLDRVDTLLGPTATGLLGPRPTGGVLDAQYVVTFMLAASCENTISTEVV